ncbi:MAG: ABC transporter permease [Planctomycetota bacterium]|nr:ABC transporter permease [Planctomycetota bacterium]
MPYFHLAWRYASRRLVNLIAVVAIALALAVQIVAMAVLDGMLADMEKRVRNLGEQVTIRVEGEPPNQAAFSKTAEAIRKVNGVRGVTPLIQRGGIIESGGSAKYVLVQGIDLAAELAYSSLSGHLLSYKPDPDRPEWGTNGDRPGIFLGEQLGRDISAAPGNEVDLFYAIRNHSGGFDVKSRKFRVVSLFRSGVFQKDDYGVYIPISEAGSFYFDADYPEPDRRVEVFVAWLENPARADELEPLIAQAARSTLSAETGREPNLVSDTWQKRWGGIAEGMKHENNLMELVLFLNDGASGFCVFAILVTLVSRRIRDVGLLRCIGATRRGVLGAFLIVGLILGASGGILGVAGGMFLSGPLTLETVGGETLLSAGGAVERPLSGLEKADDRRPRLDIWYEALAGQPLYPPRMFGISGEAGLPMLVRPWKLALYFFSAVLVAVSAAAYPAAWAACREPMSALRED